MTSRSSSDEQQDRSSSNPCAVYCTQGKHTQLTEQSTSCAHEVEEEQNRHSRNTGGGCSEEGDQKETLIESATPSNRGGLSVNEKDSRRDSLSPEVWWKLRGNQESMRGLKNMTMLTFGNTILSMSTK